MRDVQTRVTRSKTSHAGKTFRSTANEFIRPPLADLRSAKSLDQHLQTQWTTKTPMAGCRYDQRSLFIVRLWPKGARGPIPPPLHRLRALLRGGSLHRETAKDNRGVVYRRHVAP